MECECGVVFPKRLVLGAVDHAVGLLPKDGEVRRLAVDPGGVCGLAWNTGRMVCVAEVKKVHDWKSESRCAGGIAFLVDKFFQGVVVEDFVLDPDRAVGGRDGLAAERMKASILAVLVARDARWITRGGGVVINTASMAKTTFTDARLKKLGLCVEGFGEGHARDAVRHLLLSFREGGFRKVEER